MYNAIHKLLKTKRNLLNNNNNNNNNNNKTANWLSPGGSGYNACT